MTRHVLPRSSDLAFQAECVAYTTTDRLLIWLGSQSTNSAWLAVGWLARRATRIAEQLDPPSAAPVWAWLADCREHVCVVERLGDRGHGRRGRTSPSELRD